MRQWTQDRGGGFPGVPPQPPAQCPRPRRAHPLGRMGPPRGCRSRAGVGPQGCGCVSRVTGAPRGAPCATGEGDEHESGQQGRRSEPLCLCRLRPGPGGGGEQGQGGTHPGLTVQTVAGSWGGHCPDRRRVLAGGHCPDQCRVLVACFSPSDQLPSSPGTLTLIHSEYPFPSSPELDRGPCVCRGDPYLPRTPQAASRPTLCSAAHSPGQLPLPDLSSHVHDRDHPARSLTG